MQAAKNWCDRESEKILTFRCIYLNRYSREARPAAQPRHSRSSSLEHCTAGWPGSRARQRWGDGEEDGGRRRRSSRRPGGTRRDENQGKNLKKGRRERDVCVSSHHALISQSSACLHTQESPAGLSKKSAEKCRPRHPADRSDVKAGMQ
jgi:hypothetical protein